MRYDPGADAAARYPEWVIRRRALGWGIREVLCHRTKVILIEARSSYAERRSSLAHAVAHLDLAHLPARGRFDRRQEAQAHQLAARRLLPLDLLLQAARWTRNAHEAATELDVDVPTLVTRIEHLHPSERARLRFIVRTLEETA